MRRAYPPFISLGFPSRVNKRGVPTEINSGLYFRPVPKPRSPGVVIDDGWIPVIRKGALP